MNLIDESNLPCPRLELRWSMLSDGWKSAQCDYNFVFPLGEHDIRREVEPDEECDDGEETPELTEMTVKIGSTTRNSSKGHSPLFGDSIDTPYRDGAHAKWDAPHFGNPPIYAVCEGKAMLIVNEALAAARGGV